MCQQLFLGLSAVAHGSSIKDVRKEICMSNRCLKYPLKITPIQLGYTICYHYTIIIVITTTATPQKHDLSIDVLARKLSPHPVEKPGYCDNRVCLFSSQNVYRISV